MCIRDRLNTSTALQVDYQDAARRLVLLAGEILIETARDGRGRPFFVQTPAGRLQALGTRFSVQLQERQTRLDVFDGAVEILTQSGEQGDVYKRQVYDCAFPFRDGKASVGYGCKNESDGEHRWWSGGRWQMIDVRGKVVE